MRILQIAYYYPPMGGAGVQRALKFSKYLSEFGVQPVVLAALDPHYVHDASLAAEVPAGLAVHRVADTPLLARLAARRRTSASGGAAAAPSRWRTVLRDTVLATWHALQYPDDKARWARRALREARAILREQASRGEPIELIFTSSPPASAHWVGERLSREFGLPWVADFRDLWTDNPAYAAPAWRRALDRRLEQRWFDRASGVVTVTESWQRLLAARRSADAPVAFIPNGYDEADFQGLCLPARAPGVFTLVHTGTFYGPRDPAALLEGLSRYLDGPRDGHAALRVRLIGNMGARFRAQLQAFGARHPGVIECVDYLPHTAALAELMAADALLLVVGGGRGAGVQGWLPGKIFEYLRAAKPVLMLGAPEGDAAQLIRRHATGWVVDERDVEGVATALRSMLSGKSPAAAGAEPATEFERRALARRLAEFMARCVSA